jgi:prepilin-type processing-associated H-X9-DG protein
VNLRQVREPSRTVLYAETTNNAPGTANTAGNNSGFTTSNPSFLRNGTRHRGIANVSFFDASVRSFNQAQLDIMGRDSQDTAGGSQTGNNSLGVIWSFRAPPVP